MLFAFLFLTHSSSRHYQNSRKKPKTEWWMISRRDQKLKFHPFMETFVCLRKRPKNQIFRGSWETDEWNRSETEFSAEEKKKKEGKEHRQIWCFVSFSWNRCVVDFDLILVKNKTRVGFIRYFNWVLRSTLNSLTSSKFKLRRSCQVGRTYRFLSYWAGGPRSIVTWFSARHLFGPTFFFKRFQYSSLWII